METNTITIQIPAATVQTESDYLQLGRYQPVGRTLNVNSRYLELDGKPWLPIMGEFHYSRYPACEWERELRKMQAAGVNIIASYVFWNHHEEIEGQYDWSGNLDLRRFVELVKEIGLLFYLRPGPWVHAEARNGGFPDWLLTRTPMQRDTSPAYREEEAHFFEEMMNLGPVRCNDPLYLKRVARFYNEIGAQLKGLMWEDGGPIIGAQLENEYHRTGPGCGAEHIAELKRLAIEAGLRMPMYTVTGWPTLDIPLREVVPVSGAYPDGFWQNNDAPLPPSGVYVFNTERAIGEMGNVGGTAADGPINKEHYPFFLAEAGGGMHISYHRRPVVGTDDLAATTLVQIGSGANLYGYYMFHGGTNPIGKFGYQNETQSTGYPNDVGLLGYDFHAPLGQYGRARPSFGRLRTLHLFAAAFGQTLAPMEAVLADGAIVDAADRSQLRVAARGAGDEAYLFINNHVRHYPQPDFHNVVLKLNTTNGELSLPAVNFPSGCYCIWPVGHRIGTSLLRYATVQPLSRWEEGGQITWIAFSQAEQTAQLCFDATTLKLIDAGGAKVTQNGADLILGFSTQKDIQRMRFADNTGIEHTVIVLSQAAADQAGRVRLGGRERLVLSQHVVYQDKDALVLCAPASEDTHVRIFPADGLSAVAEECGFADLHFAAVQPEQDVSCRILNDQAQAPAVKLGPHIPWRTGPVPLMPEDSAFDNTTRIAIEIPEALKSHKGRVELEIDFVGDIGRLYADGKLVDDKFYDGEPWFVGVDRYACDGRWPTLELRILAAPAKLPIFLEREAQDRLEAAPHRAKLLGVRATAWRELRFASSLAS